MTDTPTALVSAVHTRVPQLTEQVCARAVDAVLDAIREALALGHSVELGGLGALQVVESKARKATVMQNGALLHVTVPACRRVRFVTGHNLSAPSTWRTQ